MTKRQRKILDMLLLGKSDKEVGVELGVPAGIAKKYTTELFRRYGVMTREDLCRYLLCKLVWKKF